MKDFPEKLLKYVLGLVLSICGWLVIQSYNRVSLNIIEMNKDIISMKLQLTEINAKMVDEDRVREIARETCTTELLKHRHQISLF